MQEFFGSSENITQMLELIKKSILWDILEEWPGLRYFDTNNLVRTLHDVYRSIQWLIRQYLQNMWDLRSRSVCNSCVCSGMVGGQHVKNNGNGSPGFWENYRK